MALVMSEKPVTKWYFNSISTQTDRIAVSLLTGGVIYFDGCEERIGHTPWRLISDRLFQMDMKMSTEEIVEDVHRCMRSRLKDSYRSRLWRLWHWRSDEHFDRWIRENVIYVIWPRNGFSDDTDGQIIFGQPLRVLPVICGVSVTNTKNVSDRPIQIDHWKNDSTEYLGECRLRSRVQFAEEIDFTPLERLT